MPNGERTTQTGYGEHGKTTVPLAGSTKNAAQLLHQNIIQDASRQGQCGAYPKRLLSVHTHRLSRYDLIGIDARPFVAPRQSVAHRQGLTNAEPIFSPKAEKRALLQVDTGQHTQRVGLTRICQQWVVSQRSRIALSVIADTLGRYLHTHQHGASLIYNTSFYTQVLTLRKRCERSQTQA